MRSDYLRGWVIDAHQIMQFLDEKENDEIQFSNMQITGAEGLVVTYSSCCRPIPGDHVIAHFSTSRGIVIHQERCKNILPIRHDPALCSPVQWEDTLSGDFSVEIKIVAEDKELQSEEQLQEIRKYSYLMNHYLIWMQL